jgi:hypothetical protein
MGSPFATTATHRLSPSVIRLSDRITRQRVGSTQQLVLAGIRWGSGARRRDARRARSYGRTTRPVPCQRRKAEASLVKMRRRRQGRSTKGLFSGPVIRRKPGRSTSPQCISTLSGWGGIAISLDGVQMTASAPVSACCANDGKPLCEADAQPGEASRNPGAVLTCRRSGGSIPSPARSTYRRGPP